MSRSEQLALDAWLKASPANADAFSRLNKLSHFGLRMREHPHLVEKVPGYANWKKKRSSDKTHWFRLALGGAAAALLVSIVLTPPAQTDQPSVSYATKRGEQRQVGLADGSAMMINTDSRLAVRYSHSERRVVLERGEALFDVAKDSSRPFVVQAGTTEVRAVGTQFMVRLDQGEASVVVLEGEVKVFPAVAQDGPRVELRPGDKVAIIQAANSQSVQLGKVNASRASAWMDGYLDFEDAPLESVVAEVNRYAQRPFHIEDGSLRGIRLSARFKIGDADALRFALSQRLGVQAHEEDGRVVLHR
jgi:transmembrane sensor